MKFIWNIVEKKDISKKRKHKLFLVLNTLFFSCIGLLLWGIMYMLFKINWTWGICLIGYPGFFAGYLGGLLYLMNNQ